MDDLKIKENLKKYLNLTNYTLEKEKNAYSHDVYKITAENKSYIYKKYKKASETEKKILKALGRDIIIDTSKFRIEPFYEFRMPDFIKDAESIGKSIREFNNLKIELNSFFDLTDKMIKKIFKIKITFLLSKRIKERFYKLTNQMKPCHNDLQKGNILMRGEEAFLIDFEYATLNNPLFDYANIFCEMGCDYEASVVKKELLPNEGQKKEILKKYLMEEYSDEKLSITNKLMCCSHFLWYLWSKSFVKEGSNSFNYFAYGVSRLSFLQEEGFLSEEEFIILKNDLKE